MNKRMDTSELEQNRALREVYRKLFILGALILLLSLFFEFYAFSIFFEDELVVSWSYVPVTGWSTVLKGEYNESYRPEGGTEIPIYITMLYMVLIGMSIFGAFFRDVEEGFEKAKTYLYVTVFLLILNGFYLFAYPLFYLYSHELYFPFFLFHDIAGEEILTTEVYRVGWGYTLQLVGFLLIFPWTVFQYYLLTSFEEEQKSAEMVMEKLLAQRQKSLDLDRLIAREETEIRLENRHQIKSSRKYIQKESSHE
jgi:hypothetical protein